MEKAFDLSVTKKLGFGLMRLPKKDGAIDLDATKKLVDLFMARGFTYFDTAYVYDNGESEIAARKCIVERYPRDKFTIATKFPAGAVESEDEVEKLFQTSLKRLGVDYIDYYLVHALGKDRYDRVTKANLWEHLKEWKAKGLVKHVGFSTHDTPEFIDTVLNEHPDMEFVQLQINYLDWEDAKVQSHACYDMVRSHGRPIVIMEPIKGGSLAGSNEEINAILKAADPDSTPASWALRFAAGHEGVAVVLSGMNDISQVEENTVTLDNPRPITAEEQTVLNKVVTTYNAIERVPCTRCRYCIDGCPMGIDIPGIIALVNNYRVYKSSKGGPRSYDSMDVKASACVKCRACESVCPQHISIPEVLEEAVGIYE